MKDEIVNEWLMDGNQTHLGTSRKLDEHNQSTL